MEIREPCHGKANKKQLCKQSEVKLLPASLLLGMQSEFAWRRAEEVAILVRVHVFVFHPFPAAGSLLSNAGVCVGNQCAFCDCSEHL